MPNKADVLRQIAECDQLGVPAFLAKYANGRGSRTTWIDYAGREYPIKAIWASAHSPAIPPRSFKTNDAEPELKRLGFSVIKR
ncbi:hypothetical protein Saro_0812 [Novosphingobium aromaticivorans DSM 12444]|uniref:ScoMcrA-like N-terminal head domain-containing protein n=1 Tax=Novosphingobium aromaticivorans (strain ATCC 700278 / DSM 12444 / CCUG 56034 / CIP 105152 / NBRC 16084 / F199) TaxID=279238 RepID=Q2GA66_NOVAD|nr:hypothetical protein [Novosphingobium aromaticivorans]ABD25257.1 hypothetical protein Saro_0812 [Novosphingobium aromaticivorans DSM 12444]